MKITSCKILLLVFSFAVSMAGDPVRIIYDTDIGNDVDDALALAMIHALQDRGHCELLAVTITKDHELAGAFTDAINTFYGRPDTPVGTIRDGDKKEVGRFNILAEKRAPDGSFIYPHDLLSGKDAPEATSLLRKLLAGEKDQSLVLIQVGSFTNFARLLRSKPDAFSPLDGRELIRKKVKLLSIMGGSFAPVRDSTHFTEFNVKWDIPSAQIIADEWPTPIVWSGYEIGFNSPYPSDSILRDFEYVDHHPVKEAYILYNPPPHNRPTWDLTSVIAAVWPDRGYFSHSVPGKVTVEDDGYTEFIPKRNGSHTYLKIDPMQVTRLTEAFVQLVSQPPAE